MFRKIKYLLLTGVLILILLMLLSVTPQKVVQEKNNREKMTEVDIEIIEDRAKKQPVPKKAPPAKAPPSKAAPASASASASSANRNDDAPGTLPPLYANYREYLGFRNYATAMQGLGARFFIIGSSRKHFFGVDFKNEALYPVSLEQIRRAGFSPRTRVISDEPAIYPLMKKAVSKYRISSPELVLLVPQAMENKIAVQVGGELAKNNRSIKDISGLQGFYFSSGGRLMLKITEAIPARGETLKMNFNVTL